MKAYTYNRPGDHHRVLHPRSPYQFRKKQCAKISNVSLNSTFCVIPKKISRPKLFLDCPERKISKKLEAEPPKRPKDAR